jgi:protein-disulfide isomerase
VIVAAVVVVVVLVVVSQGGSSGGGGAANPSRFSGIPQRGLVLGSPDAPVRMVEYADLQCPFCAQYDRDVLPTLVKRYVRAGQLRLELRPLAFIGPDSVRMARVVEAAAEQNRAWQLIDLIYHNQGQENSGYATDAYLRKLMAKVPGLDAGQAVSDASSSAVAARLQAVQASAKQSNINSTPYFLIGHSGGHLATLLPSALEPGPFTDAVDQQLR